MTDGAPPGRRPRRAAPLRQLLVVSGLTGFAISQPVLGVLGDNPTTLTHHGVEGSSLVVLVLLVALVPPVVLWALPALVARRARAAGAAAHLVVVSLLAACVAVQLLKAAGIDRPAALAVLAGGVGVAFAAAYARVEWVATWAAYTAFLPVLAVGFLLAASPASDLLRVADPPERTEPGTAPVVLLLLDELPTRSLLAPDHTLDAARVPHLAAFAEEATWYRHHTAVVPSTELAVPSLLTGTWPRVAQPLWTEHPDNLFSLLGATHELEVMEAATHLCPYDVCAPTAADGEVIAVPRPGFWDAVGVSWDLWLERIRLGPERAPRLDDFAEPVVVDPGPASADVGPDPQVTAVVPDGRGLQPDGTVMRATSARADAFLSSFDSSKGSALYYLHLLLPHQPWTFRPDGELYAESDPIGATLPEADRPVRFAWNAWQGTVSEQRAILQLQYTDRLVGRILAQLRTAGLYDESLVIVKSDHGFSFEPGTPPRRVTEENLEALAYTPLLVKLPHQRAGGIDDSNVTAVDVLPTIASVLDVTVPWEVDGAPLGSAAVAARIGTKRIQDVTGLGDVEDHGTISYDDAARFGALLRDRRIGPLLDPGDPLSGLPAPSGAAPLLGRPLDAVTVGGRRGAARVFALEQLRHPGDGDALGVVEGIIDSGPDGTALLAVDGRIVAASEVSEDSDGRRRFTFLLPSPDGQRTQDVQLLVVEPDGSLTDLEVR